MANIKHNNYMDTVNEVVAAAKKEGVVQLYAEDANLDRRTSTVKEKIRFHFGTTGYQVARI